MLRAPQELPVFGDLRVLCHQPDKLGAHGLISALTFVDELPGYEDQTGQYLQTTTPALVPDPRTTRPCTPQERQHYFQSIADIPEATRRKTDVVFIDSEHSEAFLDVALLSGQWGHPGTRASAANELTTTPSNVDKNLREGLHTDSGSKYIHRLGICVAGIRTFLAGTHSRQLLRGGTGKVDPCTGDVLRYLRRDREALGTIACLSIPMKLNELYDAWTGELLHDGQTNTVPSTILFMYDQTLTKTV